MARIRGARNSCRQYRRWAAISATHSPLSACQYNQIALGGIELADAPPNPSQCANAHCTSH
jgi:hypothetical protein